MPEFQLDKSGRVAIMGATLGFDNLDAFTQGYIEALFFTENDPSVCMTAVDENTPWDDGQIYID